MQIIQDQHQRLAGEQSPDTQEAAVLGSSQDLRSVREGVEAAVPKEDPEMPPPPPRQAKKHVRPEDSDSLSDQSPKRFQPEHFPGDLIARDHDEISVRDASEVSVTPP